MVLALGCRFKSVQTDFGDGIFRAWHKYGTTHTVFKTGNTSTGKALDFGTPQHTIIMGISQVNYR